MNVWAIGDPHLSFGVPSKDMAFFGPTWHDYTEKIATGWKKVVNNDDLVLIPGDISWAMKLEDALLDLNWIDKLPGKKIILKGNHDYWWPSNKKMKESLPPSIDFIHNNVLTIGDITIGGSRLWDSDEYSFSEFIEFQENPRERKETAPSSIEGDQKIFTRELGRLNASLNMLDPKAKTRIALTHYPPIGADLTPSKASAILEAHNIDICIFGHLHNVRENSLPFGSARGVNYLFTSCDYINFTPLRVL